MIPILYPADQTQFWTNNGLGGLPDAISCVVTEQRNTAGGYWLEMDYPVDGLHFDLLAPERIIYAAPAMGQRPQPFRISRITRPINGIVHIEAPHISVELQKLTTFGTRIGTNIGAMGRGFFAKAREIGQSTHFDFASNVTTSSEITISHPEPVPMVDVLLGAEGSILDLVGGEYEFDEFDVVLHAQRGVDSGLEIRYGVNMSDLEAETDATELVTAVIPYWKGSVSGSDTFVLGSICAASNAASYAYVRCIPLDVSDQFQLEQDQLPTSAQVTAKGQAFINSSSRNQLQTSIRVKYEPITNAIGERRINLCDTVRVVYPDLGVSSISKVVETRFNTLTEQYDELTIGSIRNNIVDTIAGLISGGAVSGGGGSSSGGGSSAVTSVNGKTGAVVLNAADVGAMANTYTAPVQSVNGQTGAITLTADDVGALDDIEDVIYDINSEFHADTSDHYFTFASGINASSILAALNDGKLPIVRNTYGSLKRKWYFADYNNDGNNIYIQFFRETQFSREVMLYTESDAKAYIDSISLSSFQHKPVVVWEVQDVSQGLLALNTNISSSLAWQLTDLDLTPFKRIKIYVRAGRKTGAMAADSSITPASIIEMSLDDRAKETVSQNVFIGSAVVQNPNDANRLGMLTCAVSADKTKFAVTRATSLYGTAATSNTDCYQYVFRIEGYYD